MKKNKPKFDDDFISPSVLLPSIAETQSNADEEDGMGLGGGLGFVLG